jgi:hypothetical protein
VVFGGDVEVEVQRQRVALTRHGPAFAFLDRQHREATERQTEK